MKFYSLFLILSSILYSFDGNYIKENNFIIKTHKIFGSASNDYFKSSGEYTRNSLNYFRRFNYEKLHLDLDLEAFHHSKDMDSHKNVSLKYQKRNDIQINSIMIIYRDDYFNLYAGYIPFRGSKFSELKNPLRSGGNGIELLTDQVFLGCFASTTIQDTNFIVGYAQWRKQSNYNSLGYHNNDKSEGIFSIINKDIGKNYFEFNYFKVDVVLDSDTNPIDYATIDLVGLGYIYDDTLSSGFTFTFEGGISHSNENNYLNASNTGLPVEILRSLGYFVDNVETTGYAWKSNIRYENEILNTEYYVGFEYFKTYDNWVSMNHGTLFLSNNSYWQTKDGEQFTLYGGININKQLLIQLRYAYTHSDKVPEYFSVSRSVGVSSSPNPEDFFTDTTRIEVEISYSF